MHEPSLRFCLLSKFFLASVRLEKVLLIEVIVIWNFPDKTGFIESLRYNRLVRIKYRRRE